MKSPTNKQKIEMYERFLHQINLCITCCDDKGVCDLVSRANHWSYSHRVGNGELSDKEQARLIAEAFWNLLPNDKS